MPFALIVLNTAGTLAALFFLPFALLLCALSERWRDGFLMRLGILPGALKAKLAKGDNLWLHAASAGECKCMVPLALRLKKEYPGKNIVFSVTTLNGKRMLEKYAPGFDRIYMPLDLIFFVLPVVSAIRPSCLVVAETEYWPTLYFAVKKLGGKIAVVNGRFSDGSIKKYRLFKAFISGALRGVDVFGMREASDLERLKSLSPFLNNAAVTGDLKYESFPVDAKIDEWLRSDLKPYLKDKVVIAGSVHEKESGDLLGGMLLVLKERKNVTFIVAPRFARETEMFHELFTAAGLSVVLRSALAGAKPVEVVLLDTMGELTAAYGLSDAAFVGGSLAEDIGGHNLLEPVFAGKRAVFGAHVVNFSRIAESLERNGLGVKVKDGAGLGAAILFELAGDKDAVSLRAKEYLAKREGPLNANLKMLKEVLG